jgi:hypothetical protein
MDRADHRSPPWPGGGSGHLGGQALGVESDRDGFAGVVALRVGSGDVDQQAGSISRRGRSAGGVDQQAGSAPGRGVRGVDARRNVDVETLDVYAHLWPDGEDRTRQAVDELLAASSLTTG